MLEELKNAGYEIELVSETPHDEGETPDEVIVNVQGHGVNTNIYTHDDESVADLLSHAENPPHPRYTEYDPERDERRAEEEQAMIEAERAKAEEAGLLP